LLLTENGGETCLTELSKIRLQRVPAAALLLLASTACVDSVGNRADEDRISGVYVVQSVDGVAMPTPLAPQQGCNRTVGESILNVSAGGRDVAPEYDWSITINADCQPVPSGVYQGGDDVGVWRFAQSSQLSFSSLMGRGSYSAALEETPGNPPAITLANAGNSYRFVRIMRFDDPQGVVYIDVVDQSGQRVRGVVLIFTFANGLKNGGTTPDSGELGVRGVVGECKISITPPAGYAVPASQPNPLSVTVVDGGAPHFTVTLTKL
jgi:hypothetical protein